MICDGFLNPHNQDVLISFDNLHDEVLQATPEMNLGFDFLTAQDLISSVINLSFEERMVQVIDGTKINTDYIDVMYGSHKVSYEIPFSCFTQQPVVIDSKLTLPIFCGKTKSEFEMKFIDL